MKPFEFLTQSDIHLMDAGPRKRALNYYDAQFKKLGQLLSWAKDRGIPVFIPGDLLDASKPSYYLVNRLEELFERYHMVNIYLCLGQHEMPGHSLTLKKSPVYGIAKHLDNVNLIKDQEQFVVGIRKITVTAHHWGQKEVSKPVDTGINILLGHIPVFKSVPFYWNSEPAYTPQELRDKFPGFDYYLCGDIHAPLVDDNVIVSGSMMRINVDQADFEPRAYLVGEEEVTPMYYDIEPNVFSIESIEGEVAEVDMTGLVGSLREAGKLKDHFRTDIKQMATNAKFDRTREIIKEIGNECN